MATVKYDAVATLRRTDRDGNEKKSYHKMGVVFETAKGLSLKLESIPVGFDGWVSFYEPKPKESAQQAPKRSALDELDSDMPF